MKYYHKPIWIRDTKLNILLLDGDTLKLNRYDISFLLMQDPKMDQDLEGFVEVEDPTTFRKLIEQHASKESLEGLEKLIGTLFTFP